MAKAPTVYDVAEHAGVSIATVSRVLRRPDDVKESTRDRVWSSVRELGYVPSGSARGLAARRTGVIGLYFAGFDAVGELTPVDVDGPGGARTVDDVGGGVDAHPSSLYLDEVLRGAELEAWNRGFTLMVGVGRPGSAEETVRDMAGRVDGMLILARGVSDEALAQLARRIPVVVLAGEAPDHSLDHVSVSNAEGMRALTAHLAGERGIRRFAYVAGPDDSPDDAERHAGFARAVTDAGLDAAGIPVFRGAFTRASGRDVARDVIAAGLPEAIVCANDQMALGVLDVLRVRGIRVPDDVLVSGFDGIEAGSAASPRLTTVRQHMHDVGRAGVELMRRRLQAPDAPPLASILPVDVLLRESTEGAR